MAASTIMPELSHLKRQIVRQTVAENVALIEGTRLASRRHRRARLRRWSWALVMVSGIAGTSVLLSRPWDHDGQGEASPASVAPAVERPSAAGDRRHDRSRWAADPAPLLEQAPERIDPSIFPLQVRRIVLDPGHGGEDHGTRNGGLREKEITLDLALRLRDLLRDDGFEIAMTRDTDRAVVLRQRRDFANQAAADLFVSIHVNWIVNRAVRGVETYYLGPAEDPALAALARLENENSGYTLAEQSQLIRGLVLNAQHERSRQLAGRVQGALLASLRGINPRLRDRGVKTAPFVVLIGTEMPAILAEVSCLSNAEEVELLAHPLYRDHIAEALYKGIAGYARDVTSPVGADLGP